MSLLDDIRAAQIRAGEDAVIRSLKRSGLVVDPPSLVEPPDEIATLRTQLAAAEARAERLAGALEWIQRQDLDDLRMQLVVDAERDGQYYVCGDSNKPGYGPTLLDAVESAALAEVEAG